VTEPSAAGRGAADDVGKATPGVIAGMDPELLAAITAGLSRPGQQKLPAALLYDELGSALFEAISALPEYGLTRADERILRRHAPAITRGLATPLLVAELGSGTGRKTRWILDALASRQTTHYFPIDISETALAKCATVLGRLPAVRFEAIHADYLAGLANVAAQRRSAHHLLVLFLGSTIGNFEPDAARSFLREVRRTLKPGDALLLGTDRVKPAPTLIRAYDDPLGVTAAFDRNLLTRMNRDLGASFDLSLFRHEARWREAERRIEMHLVAKRAHEVAIPALDLRVAFKDGESIWTESSYKFEKDDVAKLAKAAGFEVAAEWVDEEWPFAETLLRV
jgi:dimethylhistidine N-methyltransferase